MAMKKNAAKKVAKKVAMKKTAMKGEKKMPPWLTKGK